MTVFNTFFKVIKKYKGTVILYTAFLVVFGFMYTKINNDTNKVEIAPIFDCASCLYPKLEDEKINNILNDENEIEKRGLHE